LFGFFHHSRWVCLFAFFSPSFSKYLPLKGEESPEALTERETEVLRLLAQGQSNKQIAHSLHNTEQTIKTHVSRILSKLGVQIRTQATLYAIRIGLVSPSSPDTAG
jgi:DNA-binding NarL/FixJ family response regulator